MKKNILWTGVLLVLTAAGFVLTPATADAQRWHGYRGGYAHPHAWGHGSYYHGSYYHGSYYHGGYNHPWTYGYYNPGHYGFYYGNSSYGYPRYYSSSYPQYSYYAPSYGYAPSVAYYPSPTVYEPQVITTAHAPTRTTAHFVVRVPTATAQVWIDGRATSQTGMERHFETPKLEPAQAFTFEFRARWMVNGEPREQTKLVSFRAGDTANVDFTVGAGE